MSVDPTDVLREARVLLQRPYGWVKGHLHKSNSEHSIEAYCAVGAIQAAARSLGATSAVQTVARHRVAVCLDPASVFTDGSTVLMWNDAPYTHKADVLAVFASAIEDVRT